ncbi:hypothetical protein [Desulfopila aestuarii]|uniref:Uncharacterized protein n=1 Tax=Desulfopila aestuarii DSM 18488 TaxID=1121416 RepID=A0A1M7YK47_9BACT|nr:hypothetical protein [Desulfopila aestuarii]SHO52972.1 hypothetical protein SAMN02745220_04862 [Desulfopila aestuarii DSM 18488]
MDTYQENFEKYQALKTYAARTGISVTALRKLADREFRNHLIQLHGDGSPLSEITGYLSAFYDLDISPQHLRKLLKITGGDTWNAAILNYRQYRHVRRQEKLISAIGD